MFLNIAGADERNPGTQLFVRRQVDIPGHSPQSHNGQANHWQKVAGDRRRKQMRIWASPVRVNSVTLILVRAQLSISRTLLPN